MHLLIIITNMIDHYKRGDTIQTYLDNCVNNPDLISQKSLLERATKSINELRNRDANIRKEYCKKKVMCILLV